MKRALCLAAVLLALVTAPTFGQSLEVDHAVRAWSAQQQKTADVLSNVAVYSALGFDTWESWRAADRGRAFKMEGFRLGVLYGGAFVTKHLVHRRRPCAPTCGIDDPNTSFFSGHTATMASVVSGHRMVLMVPLTAGTGYLRIAANKHYLTDVLAGAAAGWLAGRIR